MDVNIEKRVTEEGSTLQEAVQHVIDRFSVRLDICQSVMVSLSVGPAKTALQGGSLD